MPKLPKKKPAKKKVKKTKMTKENEEAIKKDERIIIDKASTKLIEDYAKKNVQLYDVSTYRQLMENPQFVTKLKQNLLYYGKQEAPGSLNRQIFETAYKKVEGWGTFGSGNSNDNNNDDDQQTEAKKDESEEAKTRRAKKRRELKNKKIIEDEMRKRRIQMKSPDKGQLLGMPNITLNEYPQDSDFSDDPDFKDIKEEEELKDDFDPPTGSGKKKVNYGESYYQFNSIIVEVPEKLLFMKKNGKEQEVTPITDVTKQLRTRTIDGKKIKSIQFKSDDNIKEPKVVSGAESHKFGKIIIDVPSDLILVKNKPHDKQTYTLRQAITKSKALSQAKNIGKSIIIEPKANITKVKVKIDDTKPQITPVKPKRKKATKKAEVKQEEEQSFNKDFEKSRFMTMPIREEEKEEKPKKDKKKKQTLEEKLNNAKLRQEAYGIYTVEGQKIQKEINKLKEQKKPKKDKKKKKDKKTTRPEYYLLAQEEIDYLEKLNDNELSKYKDERENEKEELEDEDPEANEDDIDFLDQEINLIDDIIEERAKNKKKKVKTEVNNKKQEIDKNIEKKIDEFWKTYLKRHMFDSIEDIKKQGEIQYVRNHINGNNLNYDLKLKPYLLAILDKLENS